MLGVLEGFAIVAFVIAVGMLLAHLRFLDASVARILARLSFWIATPALLVGLVATVDIQRLIAVDAYVHGIAVVVTALVAIVVWRLVFRASVTQTTVGVLSSTYSNSVNLGVPIAVYALGDATAILPLVLIQLVIMQPVALAVLDGALHPGRLSARRVLRPLVNPLILATAVGLILAATGWELPLVVAEPLSLIGGMAVPAMLLAFGISLRLGPRPGTSSGMAQPLTATALKLVLMPLLVWAVSVLFFDLDAAQLLAVTVVGALPTAQNIYVLTASYRVGENFARDVVFLTSVLALPVVLFLTWILAA